MSLMEIDPLLKRGIRLLHSKSRDSLEQLKNLAFEALHANQRGSSGKLDIRRDSPVSRSRHSSPSPNTLTGNRELKRPDHLMQDDGCLSLIPPKRSRLTDAPSSVPPHTPSPTPSIRSDSSSRGGGKRSDESDQEADFNDLAMEITSGISCTVCKKISFYSNNQLVECQDCHLLYHQECHKPPVSKADVTDPRRVWYCTKCTRNMRKQTSSSSTVSPSSSSIGSSTRSSSAANSASNSSSSKSSSSSRHAPSPSKGSSTSSTHSPSPSKATALGSSGGPSSRLSPFTNLCAVTTRQNVGSDRSLSSSRDSGSGSGKLGSSSGGSGGASGSGSGSSGGGRAATSSSGGGGSDSKGSSNAPTSSAPSNSLLSAERRMQMMKKKAAAKMAERRKV